MPFVNAQNITGLNANKSDDAPDWLEDNDPVIVAYLAAVNVPAPDPLAVLTQAVKDKDGLTDADLQAASVKVAAANAMK